MDTKTIGELKQKLIAEKAELEKLLSGFAKKDPKMKGDWDARFPKMGEESDYSSGALEERADEVEEYEAELSEEFALEERLREVNASLAKVADGTYGKCSKCGAEIPLERMMANPAAAEDIEHAR